MRRLPAILLAWFATALCAAPAQARRPTRQILPPQGRKPVAVEDDGPGLGDGLPKGTGLGSKIISAMAGGLRSAIEVDPAHRGVRALLAFDL